MPVGAQLVRELEKKARSKRAENLKEQGENNKTVRETLIKEDKYHVTVKILVYSIWVMAGGVGSMTYHYMSYR